MISKYVKFLLVFLAATIVLDANAAVRKYHPGHYVSMYKFDDSTDMMKAIKPGVVGMERRYAWSDLETSLGVYDFSKIQADLNFLSGQGMRLIVLIEDKSFGGGSPTPPYLQAYILANNKGTGGYTAIRWSPYVVTRMKALMDALGKKFDAQPNFEGVALQESALGLSSTVMKANGYTPEKYRDALISDLIGAAQSFPTSRVFWYMNFLTGHQSYIADIATAVAPYDVIMGGPDVLPDSASLKKLTYPFYTQFAGKMKLFGSMQFDSYRHLHADTTAKTKYWTMDEMFRFARDNLHVNYVIWNRTFKPSPSDSYSWGVNAIPVIGANPAFNLN